MKRTLFHHLSPLVLLTILILSASIIQTRAQETNRAGLVVQFGDGTLNTFCLPLDGQEFSGFDLLEASGLALVTAFDPSGGAAVCKIEDDGCPKDNCFCEVDTYWSYWHLENGEWVYSQNGSSLYTLAPGDVDGWRWSQGDPPPVIPFEQVCAPAATDTPTASPTATSTNSPTPTPTTPVPTSTSASAYPGPENTATPYPGPEITATPYPGPQVTATPYPGPEDTETPPTASPTPHITDTPEAYPAPEGIEASPSPTSIEPTLTETIDLTPELAITQTEVPAGTPTPAQERAASGTAGIETALLVFGVLTIALGGGLLIVLYRQGRL